jgi:NAD(P)H-dependent flavin oxidoreductase YrpB (nitropropane dioxygenase family)
MTRLQTLLGIDIPIIQAPTGSVAGPELAIAVSLAGGLGSLGLTWTDEDHAVAAVHAIQTATSRPFMVNYALSFDPATLDAVLDAGAPVIGFSWGDPASLIHKVHSSRALVAVQVASVAGAVRAFESGADILICQGIEAGGHVQSTTPIGELLDDVRESAAGAIPVVAAGGIVDGMGIAKAIRSGADGAMLGTRFVATQESRAHEDYKRLLVEASGDATALTICFDGGWRHSAHRVLRNSTLNSWEAGGCPPPGKRPGEGDIVGTTAAGVEIVRYEDTAPRMGMAVDAEAMALYAGSGVNRITDVPAAADLLHSLWDDATNQLSA